MQSRWSQGPCESITVIVSGCHRHQSATDNCSTCPFHSINTWFLGDGKPCSGLSSLWSWYPYARALLPKVQACATVTESERVFSSRHVFSQKLPPSFIAKTLSGTRHEPKISLKLILLKTFVFQEPHCPLHLSLIQSNSSPALTGFPNFTPGKWRLKYRFLPFHRAPWPWHRIIHLISKTFTYQESQGKTSFAGQNTYC